GARGGQKRRTERVTWSILIDGPLSKAARAEVDRKYRVTSDLPECYLRKPPVQWRSTSSLSL
ncbi:hypothetical protein JTM01_32680, partial [Pseudomonas aeruginosa]|nr:hypothetical protein [Pseudomonas aeruginosa]MBN0941026.1 hypothetical protein [Pseudomonas aeruginosa]